MFLVILAVVSAAIVAFIIYTLTMGKIREIAVLKLIGTKNRTIVSMILQQAVGLGVLGFMIGKIAAAFWALFPQVCPAAGPGRGDGFRGGDRHVRPRKLWRYGPPEGGPGRGHPEADMAERQTRGCHQKELRSATEPGRRRWMP